MLGRKVFFFDPDQMHKRSGAANASSCHTAHASLLAAYTRAFTKLSSSTFSGAVPLLYHVLFPLLWDNHSSYYFPSDLQEAIVKSRDVACFLFQEGTLQQANRTSKFQEKYGIPMVITFLVTRLPSSSVKCSSVTDSPGMCFASSPQRMWHRDQQHTRWRDLPTTPYTTHMLCGMLEKEGICSTCSSRARRKG